MKKRIISLILVFLMVFSLSIPVAAAQGTTQSGTCTDSQTLLLSNVDNFCEEFDIQQELPAMYSDEDVYLLGTTDYTYVIKFCTRWNTWSSQSILLHGLRRSKHSYYC